jgi:hypothetical protein
MKILVPSLRQLFMAALLPAAAAFSACGNDDDNNTPAPEQGKALVVHAAAVSNVPITAFVADQQVAQLNYGANSPYFTVNAGSPVLRINSGTQVLASAPLAVSKDQSYSAFVYSPSATIGSTPTILTVPDDLTAPVAGQAKVRLVHLALNAPTPVRLTVPSALPGTPGTDVTTDVAFASASGFTAINAASLNLSVTAGTPRAQVIAVGDGSGTGTGVKNYESGKIYTILVRGIAGAGVSAPQQPQAVVIQHN